MTKDNKIKIITTETIFDLFKDYDYRVQDMLVCVVDDLQHQYKVIPSFFRITLELLSTQLDIYFKAKDKLRKSEATELPNKTKSVEFTQIQDTHNKIMAIMRELGMTSMSKKKMEKLSKLTSDSSLEELYDALVA